MSSPTVPSYWLGAAQEELGLDVEQLLILEEAAGAVSQLRSPHGEIQAVQFQGHHTDATKKCFSSLHFSGLSTLAQLDYCL